MGNVLFGTRADQSTPLVEEPSTSCGTTSSAAPLPSERNDITSPKELLEEPCSDVAEGRSQMVGMGTTMVELMKLNSSRKRTEGIIKYIPEDFVVNEIDCHGNILVSCRSVKRHVAAKAVENERRRISGEMFLKQRMIGSELGTVKFPEELFTRDDCNRINSLLDALALHMNKNHESTVSMKNPPFCLLTLRDTEKAKELRTRAHVYIRENMPFLDSSITTLSKVSEKETTYLPKFMPNYENMDGETVFIKVFPRNPCLRALQRIRAATDDSKQEDTEGMAPSGEPSLGSIVKHLDVTDYGSFPRNNKEKQKMKRYLHFTIHKRDRSTHEITHMLCKALHRSSSDIFSAGNKDRRAITTQQFCVRRATIEDFVTAISQGRWLTGVVASDFWYHSDRLHLGDLRGNNFWVTIRGLKDIETAKANFKSLKTHGFLNYFGLQRFGSHRVGTHCVGAALIRREYEEAARLIINDDDVMNKYLAVQSAEKDDNDCMENDTKRQCTDGGHQQPSPTVYIDLRGHLTQQDSDETSDDKVDSKVAEDASDAFSPLDMDNSSKSEQRTSFIERELINGMRKQKKIEDVLKCIPANVLSIYLHATQSLVFNYVLTERLKRYGVKPVPGDFAIKLEPFEVNSFHDSESRNLSRGKRPLQTHESDVFREQQISVVGSGDIGKWSIYDIVLPLPGDGVSYPGFLKDVYEKISQEHFGLSLDMYATFIKNLPAHLKGRERCLVSIGGGYRHIVAKAHGLQYYFIPEPSRLYDTSAPLPFMQSRNNMQSRHSVGKDTGTATFNGQQEQRDASSTDEDVLEYNTVVVTCSLPKSCYLTCALREVLSDESLENQQAL